MTAFIGRNWSSLFKLIKHRIVVFDKVYILFHFNIILKHKGMSSTKIILVVPATLQLPQRTVHSLLLSATVLMVFWYSCFHLVI
jgi:hypothetical protein